MAKKSESSLLGKRKPLLTSKMMDSITKAIVILKNICSRLDIPVFPSHVENINMKLSPTAAIKT
jgi:hypothetical protein